MQFPAFVAQIDPFGGLHDRELAHLKWLQLPHLSLKRPQKMQTTLAMPQMVGIVLLVLVAGLLLWD